MAKNQRYLSPLKKNIFSSTHYTNLTFTLDLADMYKNTVIEITSPFMFYLLIYDKKDILIKYFLIRLKQLKNGSKSEITWSVKKIELLFKSMDTPEFFS